MPDQEAFDQVFEQEYPRVYHFALRLCRSAPLAEELAQQTFFIALQKMDRFRGECRLGVWLCQIAKHEFFAHQRRQHKRESTLEELGVDATNPAPWEAVERLEETCRIYSAIRRMEEPYKGVFSLRVFGELSYREIARLHAKTESWVRVTYYRAKLKLQNMIKEDDS